MNAESIAPVMADRAPSNKHPRLLWVAFLAVIAVVLLQNVLILTLNPSSTGNAVSDQAFVSACINSPPTVTANCSQYSFVGSSYSCRVNGTDTQQSSLTYNVTRLTGPVLGNSLFTMSGPWMNFTPILGQNGSYVLLFSVDDGTECGNNLGTLLFNLSINISQSAPFLLTPIPDQQWAAGTTLVAFNLNNYFLDPNGDPLVYSVSGNTYISITIAAGEVTLTPATDWCGGETVVFTATDPSNNTASSNSVRLNVTCPPAATASSSSSSGGSSGGSGGGSSATASALNSCVRSYSCYQWSTCQYTRYVTKVNGTINKLLIESVKGSDIYTIAPEASFIPESYYEGFQYRQCIDTRRCGVEDTQVQVQTCSYAPNCFDGIKNQDEVDVDCGGICGACSKCSDGIQNGLEEGIDCGGPFCGPCNTCINKKMDGDEEGVDCGGPDCPSCGTCFDNIQNGLEEGVDCGGPFCRSCAEEEFPLAGMPWLSILLAILVGIALLFLIAITLKRQLASMLMRLLLTHKRRNRRILIPSDLKAEILRRLSELESKVKAQPMLRSQEELAGIIRDYFRGALGIPFEFTNEELSSALVGAKLNPLLESILKRFFDRINVLEFSGLTVRPLVFLTLVQETREIVYQTAVLTVDDLRERERDLIVRDIPAETPGIDKGYLLLSEVQQALQFGKLELADALYAVLDHWYLRANVDEQRAVYVDLLRVYDELRLAHGAETATPMPATAVADANTMKPIVIKKIAVDE